MRSCLADHFTIKSFYLSFYYFNQIGQNKKMIKMVIKGQYSQDFPNLWGIVIYNGFKIIVTTCSLPLCSMYMHVWPYWLADGVIGHIFKQNTKMMIMAKLG